MLTKCLPPRKIAATMGAIALSTFIPLQANAAGYSKVFVFGDSLSDSGRVFGRLGIPGSPYFNGRFSNGPVWAEYLSSNVGVTFNSANSYAFGGATSDNRNSINPFFPGLNPPLPGFSQELSLFENDNPVAPSDALYVILIGANDYNRFGQTDVSIPVNNIKNGVEFLYARGARKFVVLNLLDLGITPENIGNPTNAARLTGLVKDHNQLLATTLNALPGTLPGASIVSPDLFSLSEKLIQNSSAYGFTNVTDACFVGGVVCANPEQYLFWDAVHPSARAHQLIGQFATDALGIPEPSATFGLVALGIGFLGTRLVGKSSGEE
jgi:phospholipase/lecithinase/hemolysin